MLYALRAAYLLCHFMAVCVFALGYCLIKPRHRNATTKLASMMSWALPWLGIQFQAKNPLPLGQDQQAVFVVNHQDTLDIFICTAMLPPNIAILGKNQLKYVPIFGLSFWLAGNIFIDRYNKAKAWDTMASVARKVKRRRCSLYMFPEGTRSQGKGLLPFKSGAFALAVQSGLPIVPIVFSSTHKNVDLNKLRAGVVLAEHLDPIATHGLGEADIKPLMELTRQRMQAAQTRLDQEASLLAQSQAHKYSLSEQIHRYLKSR